MKKISFVVVASFMLSLTIPILAEDEAPATPVDTSGTPVENIPASTPAQTAPPPAKASHEPAKALDQKGFLEKVDATTGLFSVKDKTTSEIKDFKFSNKGRVFIDGSQKTLSDLKVGDLVAVTYFAKPDGTNGATRVIKGGGKSKKKKSASTPTADEAR